MAQNNKNVLIYSIARTPDREKQFKWVGDIGYVNNCFFSLKDRTDILIENFEDAKNYRVISQFNGPAAKDLIKRGFVKGKNLFLSSTVTNAYKMLENKRGDLIGYPELVVYHIVKDLGLKSDRVINKVYCFERTRSLYFAFSLSTPDRIVNQFISGLNQLKNSKAHQKILKKYLE